MNKNNFIIRKSWIDETTELARCSDIDLAKSICKPGYTVFNEDGIPMYSVYSSNRFNHGDKWNKLKSKIEEELIRLDIRKFKLITRKEFMSILVLLFEVLKLMNEVEIEDDKNNEGV